MFVMGEIALKLTSAVMLLMTVTKRTGATCNAEQKNRCRRSAEEGQLDSIPGSGQCIVKQYVQYTHVCTVSNYVPSIDYCCCSHRPSKVMCCRYHQGWHHFRCTESNDTLDASSQTASASIGWEQLVFISLTAVVAVGCIVLCCIACVCRQCRRYRYEYGEDNTTSCCFDKYSHYSCCDDGVTSATDDVCDIKSAVVHGNSYQTTALLSTSCPVYRHHYYHHQTNCCSDRFVPSAPPPESITCTTSDGCLLPPTPSARSAWQQPRHQISDVIVSVNGTDCTTRCSSCAVTTSHPPPTYDESLYLYHPAMLDVGQRSTTGSNLIHDDMSSSSSSPPCDDI